MSPVHDASTGASFRVIAGVDPGLSFESPLEVLRASTADEAVEALDRADELLAAGAWIAGFFSYELGAALMHGSNAPADACVPLVCLGAFDAPAEFRWPHSDAPVAVSPLLPTVRRRRYDDVIDYLQRCIRDGDVYQANVTVPFHVAIAGDLLNAYAYFARRSQARYQAFVQDGDRVICSWSPELFLAIDGDELTTRPMKGTATPEREADLHDDKNRAEHVMIVDLLCNDFRRVCRDVRVDELFAVERYPTFSTMTSTIRGTLRPATTLAALLRATFPCGSVTGAPKRAAMSFLRTVERVPRDAYCGSIGFLSPERKGWWNVAIRTAQLDARTGAGRYDAGGGIVADSNAAAEWDEIRVKSSFLRSDGEAASFAILETLAANAGDDAVRRHANRMEATALAFDVPFSREAFHQAFESARGGGIVRIRLTATGKFVVKREASEQLETVRVCIAETRVWSGDPFLRHKTTWRPAYEAAGARAAEAGCFDALLRNERDEFTEGTRTNLFVAFEPGGVLWTPPRAAGLLPGILRETIVSEGRARERTLTRDDVRAAAMVYVGNSARGLLRATLI